VTVPGLTVRYLPPWRIELTVRPGVPRLMPLAQTARLLDVALRAAGAPQPASIGVVFAGDDELAALNARTMGMEGPTDVLSFPLLPPGAFPPHAGRATALHPPVRTPPFALPPGARPHLGDIVVSVERALEQAAAGRGGQTGDVAWAPADELALLVTHGVLHVCGWDHADADEQTAMRGMETAILADPSWRR
jgi:probable rRNA maturation factor